MIFLIDCTEHFGFILWMIFYPITTATARYLLTKAERAKVLEVCHNKFNWKLAVFETLIYMVGAITLYVA